MSYASIATTAAGVLLFLLLAPATAVAEPFVHGESDGGLRIELDVGFAMFPIFEPDPGETHTGTYRHAWGLPEGGLTLAGVVAPGSDWLLLEVFAGVRGGVTLLPPAHGGFRLGIGMQVRLDGGGLLLTGEYRYDNLERFGFEFSAFAVEQSYPIGIGGYVDLSADYRLAFGALLVPISTSTPVRLGLFLELYGGRNDRVRFEFIDRAATDRYRPETPGAYILLVYRFAFWP